MNFFHLSVTDPMWLVGLRALSIAFVTATLGLAVTLAEGAWSEGRAERAGRRERLRLRRRRPVPIRHRHATVEPTVEPTVTPRRYVPLETALEF